MEHPGPRLPGVNFCEIVLAGISGMSSVCRGNLPRVRIYRFGAASKNNGLFAAALSKFPPFIELSAHYPRGCTYAAEGILRRWATYESGETFYTSRGGHRSRSTALGCRRSSAALCCKVGPPLCFVTDRCDWLFTGNFRYRCNDEVENITMKVLLLLASRNFGLTNWYGENVFRERQSNVDVQSSNARAWSRAMCLNKLHRPSIHDREKAILL